MITRRMQIPKWSKMLLSVFMLVQISSSVVFAQERKSYPSTNPFDSSNSTSPGVEASTGVGGTLRSPFP